MPKYKNINDYISQQTPQAAALLEEMRAIILEAAPEASETFNYGVPAFSLIENAKAEQQILMGAFKNHIGLYPHPTTIEHFAEELKCFKQGKGSVQFPYGEELPKDLIIRMVRYRKQSITT